ncbi:MAG: sensor histidine kinase [Oliverpabstia sp.]
MRKRFSNLTLVQKFTLSIIAVGLLPMLILSTFMANNMIENYREALKNQYEQAAEYVSSSLENLLDSYDTISQMPYFYNYAVYDKVVENYLNYDNFRQIIHGTRYDPESMEKQREEDVNNFLKYVEGTDGYLMGAHFIGKDMEGKKLSFHYSSYSTYFMNHELFEKAVDYEKIDKESKKLILIPTHETGYFRGMNDPVFTVARNYFDLRGNVGNTPYVGTLFVDVTPKCLEQILRTVRFDSGESVYVINEQGDCFYSNLSQKTGRNVSEEIASMKDTENQLILQSDANVYGLKLVVVMNTEMAFQKIRSMQHMMYFILGASIVMLLISSVFFSKRLTNPIRNMMRQMEKVETGNFDIQLPVNSRDEIGVLSQRFNQMSVALKKYINEVYVAQIKQNEAELTALKSQIYPHFLYNTLEIIRMTALEDGESKVSEMIEALSEQIHYLIGPVQDFVPLEKEIDIIRKYVYLLNCRITGKVQLSIATDYVGEVMVPRLILQPIVENAYVHGIKPKKGKGSIMIEARIHDGILEISVMDSGVGMDETALEKIHRLLEGNEPGIKNEYNWQSIGLKNVHDRMRYLYGEQYGIRVTSTLKVGTMVRLLIPVNNGEGVRT